MPYDAPLEARKDVSRFRQIMYQPSACWLATENSGDRWLTDGYVMLNVTDSPALYLGGFETERGSEFGGATIQDYLPDGPYHLMSSGEVRSRDVADDTPDLEGYFERVAELTTWEPARPTEWSVAEHPGKAMLWTSDYKPCLLGESTWTAIKRHYPEVEVQYGHGRLNIFRFIDLSDDPNGGAVFCFAAGIRVPEGQEKIADAIVNTG